jgi:selenocysteine lyase/cysteine desulfurase
MSPLLKNVERLGIRGLRRKRNPAGITPSQFFDEGTLLRHEFAKLINADNAKRVAIIPSVSYGMATAARNAGRIDGTEIIVAGDQFPSNYYPWQSLCQDRGAKLRVVFPPAALPGRGRIWNERILDAIGPKTGMVAIGHVHWADGTLFQLEEIRKRTRDVGALLIIDGTQSVGALPFDVKKVQPDALVCAGYKWLLGPYSLGVAYYGEAFDGGRPIEESWMNRLHSEDFRQLVNYQSAYQEGSLRYDVGEHSNFALVPMLLGALRQVNRWGTANIQTYCRAICSEAISTLRQEGFWTEDEAYRSSHLFGLRCPGKDLDKIRKALVQKRIHVSFRGDAIRVAPHVYNRASDLRRLVKVLSA